MNYNQKNTIKDVKSCKLTERIKIQDYLLEIKITLLKKVWSTGKLSTDEKRDSKKYMREVNMLHVYFMILLNL